VRPWLNPPMESGDGRQLSDARRGERAGHAIYGSIVVLAVIIAEKDNAVTAGEAIATVVGAAVVTALAELYADYIGATIRRRRHPNETEMHLYLGEIAAGFFTALIPVVFFILAELDVIGLDAAFDIAVWTGVAILGAYAVVANLLAGLSVARSLLIGLGFTAVGAALVVLKTLA
jgi:hypothetical protein